MGKWPTDTLRARTASSHRQKALSPHWWTFTCNYQRWLQELPTLHSLTYKTRKTVKLPSQCLWDEMRHHKQGAPGTQNTSHTGSAPEFGLLSVFINEVLLGQSCLFIYVFPIAASLLQRQRWAAVRKPAFPTLLLEELALSRQQPLLPSAGHPRLSRAGARAEGLLSGMRSQAVGTPGTAQPGDAFCPFCWERFCSLDFEAEDFSHDQLPQQPCSYSSEGVPHPVLTFKPANVVKTVQTL